MSEIRTFNTGATRDTEDGKHDPEGFLSPLVILRFCEYMTKHRKQADGNLRDSDNWQKGIPLSTYMKSMWRHFLDLWMEYRGHPSREGLEDALCAIIFNAMGYLHEILIEKKRHNNNCGNITPEQAANVLIDRMKGEGNGGETSKAVREFALDKVRTNCTKFCGW